jgi:hypothetical protein
MKRKGETMANRSPQTLLGYVDTPEKIKTLVALFPTQNRKHVSALIRAASNPQGSIPRQLALYQHRLAHSIVHCEKEREQRGKKGIKCPDADATFSIGVEDSVERNHDGLGRCFICYHDALRMADGYWPGAMSLEPGVGGLTFIFWDGLPGGTRMRFHLNWSAGKEFGILSPMTVTEPGTAVLTSKTPCATLCEFEWKIIKPYKQFVVCIADNTPNLGTTGLGRTSLGADCCVYYFSE